LSTSKPKKLPWPLVPVTPISRAKNTEAEGVHADTDEMKGSRGTVKAVVVAVVVGAVVGVERMIG
jgi:hypothetical protein